MKAIIFDIDSTLSNNQHRVHWLEGEKKDWDRFYSEMDKDTPNEALVWLCRAVVDAIYHSDNADNLRVFVFTGRPENYRQQTEEWLRCHLKWCANFLTICMRPDGDHRPDYRLKQEMLDSIKAEGYDVLFAIDDRKQVVDMFRQNGIVCLQCAEGNY